MADEPLAHPTPFDAIRQVAGDSEYWSARDLSALLGYTLWQNFQVAIRRAISACVQSGHDPADHFIESNKMIRAGKGAQRRIKDWRLSRYACYLVVQNADPTKPIVALGQTYFAVQTRRQEEADALAGLSEAQQRLYLHGLLTDQTQALARTVQRAGVWRAEDFAIFQDHGYQGLYGGLGARELHVRRALPATAVLEDHMGATELAANLFRTTQTTEKLQRDRVQDPAAAHATHYAVGRAVRETIGRLGGPMPEELPTPAESIRELAQAEQEPLAPAREETEDG